MTTTNFNGSGVDNTSGFFTGDGQIRSQFNAPAFGSVRAAANGNRPMIITNMRLYIGGLSGTISASFFVANSDGSSKVSTGSFSVPERSAQLTSSKDLAGSGRLVSDVDSNTMRVGMDVSGGVSIGRNADTGNTITGPPLSAPFSNAGLAGTYDWCMVPTAPTSPAVASLGPTTATVTWGSPTDNGDASVTGYKIQWSTSSTFATIGGTVTVGAVHTANVTLPSNTLVYLRIAAINAVATKAGTTSVYSSTVHITLVSDSSDLDGWTKMGTLPGGASAFTSSNLRRASADVVGTPDAIMRESTVATPNVTLAADTYGAQRTVTGLTIGKVYRLTASAAYVGTVIDANTPVNYQLGVVGIGYAAALSLAVVKQIYDLPVYEFTATATSHAIAFRLHAGVTRTTATELERVALFNIQLVEVVSASPYRLSDLNYESTLLNHFDVADNSVGAFWWVDVYGVTQFKSALADSGAVATFTDSRAEGLLEYIGIGRSFDTRTIVNDLNLTQHTLADDASFNYKNLTSSATWGARSDDLDTSIYDQDAYAGSLNARAAEILAAHDTPEIEISSLDWNALEAPDVAPRLDIYGLIDVERKGSIQPSRIISIQHTITPARWLINFELVRKD